jgi:hypothetical protein
MKKILFISLILVSLQSYSQDDQSNFGIKAGATFGKFVPENSSTEFQYLLGFYAGGFYDFKIEEQWRFQPELLFALQGSKITSRDNVITDINGNRLPGTSTFNFQYELYELTISIPLIVKLYLSKKFYLESGPQFGFIIDRNLTSSQVLLDGNDNSFVNEGNGNFDFGVGIGAGYDISQNISLNFRAYNGLVKRNGGFKSLVFNLGIEYSL